MIDNAAVSTIQSSNSLAGVVGPEMSHECMNGFSSTVYARVRDMHAARPPPAGLKREAAIIELLGSQAYGYDDPDESSLAAPFARRAVAWPERGQVPVDLSGRFAIATQSIRRCGQQLGADDISGQGGQG